MKNCSHCKQEKELDEFNIDNGRLSGRSYICKMEKCRKPFVPFLVKSKSGDFLHPGYHIDHNHETNKVRGLLCPSCNKGLGHAYDSIEILESWIKYLKENKNAN